MAVRRVYLVRHAKAEEPGGGGDAARRLTPAGRAAFAALLRALGPRLAVRRILTSPFARARETAALLSEATGAPVVEEDALASGRSGGREILERAHAAPAGTALVGHNPEVAEAVALAAGRDEKVRPGAVAALDATGAGLSLAWLEAPRRE